MFAFLRNLGRVDWQVPRAEPATAAEFRLIQCQDRILRADETIRAWLAHRTGDPADVLLDVMVALGTAPAADDEVPGIPGWPS